MSRQTRSIAKPPDYYHGLTGKQQRNWRRNTQKIERNEQLREQYPPMPIPPATTIIHIHYLTPIKTLDELIEKAKNTKIFTIDTESEAINRVNVGALVQIQCVQPGQASTNNHIDRNVPPPELQQLNDTRKNQGIM